MSGNSKIPVVSTDGGEVIKQNSDVFEQIYQKLEYAFGVSITLNGGLASELDSSPELIIKFQNRLRGIKLNSDKVSLSFAFDEVIREVANSIRLRQKSVVAPDSLADSFELKIFKRDSNQASFPIFDYLLAFYGRCNGLVNQCLLGVPALVASILSERSKLNLVLFLRGLLCLNVTQQDAAAVFTKFMLTNTDAISPFVHDIILCCKDTSLTDSNAFEEVFTPVLNILRSCALNIAMKKRFEERHLSLLKCLLEIKLRDNSRPIADLVVSRSDFHPKRFFTEYKGREFVHFSFLGPFIVFSIAGSQAPHFEFCFETTDMVYGYDDLEQKESKISGFQTQLGLMRIKMHQIFHAFIINASTRRQTLDYISEMFNENRKLAQMQTEYEQLANPTTMLNMLSVLLDFDKIPVEKIQDDYMLHPSCMVKITEMTALKMDGKQLVEYQKKCDLSYTPTFNTECFYLTISFMGISITTMKNNLSRMERHIYEIRRQLRDAEEELQRANQNSAHLNRIRTITERTKDLLKRFTLSNMCYEALIQDQGLLSKCTNFVNKLLRLLLRSVMPALGTDPRTFNPYLERFATFPELFLETGIEFLHFLLENHQRAKILLGNMADYPKLVLYLIVNLQNIRNPFLASKIVDLIFYTCPDVNNEAVFFFRQILNDPLAVENLFSSLVKFYADVESTGSHTEFYDKFNMRRNVQVIFRCMWMDLAHRARMVQFADESTPDFYRFLNMVINDTTFLLDESLEKLKKINEVETQMANEAEWNSLREEERQHKTEVLGDAKRQVKIWLRFGTETMELFVTLTGDAPQIFRQEALGERVAAMLNNNIVQLCGPKCSQLKVLDAKKRFNWDPRKLTELIVKVYVNLASNNFAKQIAQDERSYTPDTFNHILKRFEEKSILPVSQFELFKQLVEKSEEAHSEKTKFEEEFEDEIPDEFRDAILFTLMSDPVTLPSGQVVDRKNILRHLLSDPHNPFTRQPLTEDALKPNIQLKTRITSWVALKKQEAIKRKEAGGGVEKKKK